MDGVGGGRAAAGRVHTQHHSFGGGVLPQRLQLLAQRHAVHALPPAPAPALLPLVNSPHRKYQRHGPRLLSVRENRKLPRLALPVPRHQHRLPPRSKALLPPVRVPLPHCTLRLPRLPLFVLHHPLPTNIRLHRRFASISEFPLRQLLLHLDGGEVALEGDALQMGVRLATRQLRHLPVYLVTIQPAVQQSALLRLCRRQRRLVHRVTDRPE
mmetsp:Transcript_25996/g.46227  ORF Transcript_25996/g.46227 Transcript_25996/m.46227 type:complete len:212 (+) Transcript_25996:478-1113(+)